LAQSEVKEKKMSETSLLHCFGAFLEARGVTQHAEERDVEVELRIGGAPTSLSAFASTLTREEYKQVMASLDGADSTTDWVNIKDSYGKGIRKSVINGQVSFIEKQTLAKEVFHTGTNLILTLTAKREKPCHSNLPRGMLFDLERKKKRKSFTFQNLRFDLSIVWTRSGDAQWGQPEYEVEVEHVLLKDGSSGGAAARSKCPSYLAGQLLDAGLQLVNILRQDCVRGASTLTCAR
jgi:hypothetical protein